MAETSDKTEANGTRETAATRATSNGKPLAGKLLPPPAGETTDGDEPRGKGGTFALGLLLCAVAGALAYAGLDLVSGGAVSRKLGGAAGWDDDEDENP